jgi:GAF domain-containing protein
MNDEPQRLNAVSRFKQLDAEITRDLNEIANMAAQLCNTPVALITLIDEDKQWFKGSKGVDIDCTDRNLSFCNYTIKQDSLMMVPDTTLDERFINNPLVKNDPFVCFYAGATLITKDGYAIGSLCVLDFTPRELDEQQQNSLKVLSKQVMNLMELNWGLHMMKQQQDQIDVQNAALTRIAIIQSHELRRPVASLLGIMGLIKLEKYKTNYEYFDMLELTIKELDEKICGIVKDSENTINTPLAIVA